MDDTPCFIEKDYTPETYVKTILEQSTNLDSKAVDVFAYMVIEASKYESRLFTGTYDSLMQHFGLSRGTIASIMKVLQEGGHIVKTSAGYKITDEISFPSDSGSITINFRKLKPTDFAPINIEILKRYVKAYIDSYKRYDNVISVYEENELLNDVKNLAEKYNKFHVIPDIEDNNLALDILKDFLSLEVTENTYFMPELTSNNERKIFETLKDVIEKAHISDEYKVIVMDKLFMAYKVIGKENFSWKNLYTLFSSNRESRSMIQKLLTVKTNKDDMAKNVDIAEYFMNEYFVDNNLRYDKGGADCNSVWAKQLQSALRIIYLNFVIVDAKKTEQAGI